VREDAERWDGRYAGRATGAPAMPNGLDGIELPAGGRCLDVACGLGEQSLWAASLGFDVVALDASPVAIASLRAAARDRSITVDARLVDLDDGLPADVGGDYSLVICQRFRDRRLYPRLVDALAPGGMLVVTVLSQVGAESPGPFHAPPGDLIDGFGASGLEVLRHDEVDGEATLIARRPAER
jgi:2-polyprenyl-3-methyl-5-hydroxy-6-metoxy-1,4-benzoquinol methylase